MPYRVRRLSTIGKGVVDYTHRQDSFAELSARAGAVFEIEAKELELSGEEITAQLNDGKLKTTDLVFENEAWTTFAQSVTFGDALGGKIVGEAAWRNAKYWLGAAFYFALWGAVIIALRCAHH